MSSELRENNSLFQSEAEDAVSEKDAPFSYTYAAPTASERREIEDIRRRYSGEQKPTRAIDEIQRLDGRVRNTSNAAGYGVGIFGVLVFGLGLSMFLEWQLIAGGVVVAVIGAAIAATAYPLYKFIFNRLKRKYSAEILALSEKVLGESSGSAK